MTEGYASDVEGDDTVMDSPHVTVSIDMSQLPPEQAMALAQEAGLDQFDPEAVGRLMVGEDATDLLGDATFHLPLGPGLTALSELGAVDLPQEPPEAPDEAVEATDDLDDTEVPE
jgi:hypothetical protein